MSEDLPSINDFIEDRSNLPSLNESVESDLPSYKDFIENKGDDIVVNMDGGVGGSWNVQEEVQTIEDADGNSFAEVKDIIPPFPELIRMINDVRKDIPDIPEIKSYDEELYQLTCLIEELRKDIPEIPEFPEVRYYDEEIQELKESIPTVPEVKYYDADIQELKEGLQEVKERDIPDFRWISKSFTVIDEDFESVNDSIATLKGKLSQDVTDIVESIEVAKFESKVDSQRIDSRVDTAEESIDTSKRELTEKINEVKDKIYEQLRDSSLEIWKLNKQHKDEDKKLREETLNQYNSLKENLQSTIDGVVKKTDRDYIEVNEYFKSLKKEVSNLPKVKYYDEDIKKVNQSVDKVRNLVEVLENKLNKKIAGLKESILVVPPTDNNSDPLTPLDQNFATLDDLSSHYRLFLNRIQQQLATLGGGGIEDAPKTGGPYARRNQAWETISSSSEASKLVLDVRNNNIGYALTIGTPVNELSYNSGLDIFNVREARASEPETMPAKGVVSTDIANNTNGQVIVYGELEGVNTQAFDVGDELFVAPGGGLTNVRPTDPAHLVQKIAVVLRKSTANGIILVYGAGRTNDVPNSFSIEGNISAGIITARSKLHVGVDTGFFAEDLVVNGDARITGILTVGESSVTIDGKDDKIIIGGGTTITEGGNAEFVGVVTATTVSIANTFTYPEYITGGMVPRAIKSQGGYDRTSGFSDYQTGTEASQDPADYIEYTQDLADSNTWMRLGITTTANQARDNQWWGETNPNYDNTKGLFGGLTAPAGVSSFFAFSENTAFNNAVTTGSLKYTQALGSFSLKDCQVGDLVLARFDFNVMPMVTNTTLEVALIYSNRDANDDITFTFPLTITPFTYGSGTVGKGYLLRPTITAYMANQQDVNSRSLVAIKADNPILVNPIGVLFTIQR